jgi:uncharacterized cofD-like protein
MADDGGSSGRLRREIGINPPGDVRNCLAALASEKERDFASVLGYRFPAGEGLEGHALGNLIIAALTDLVGDFEHAVKFMERHLAVRGRVLPSTFEDMRLHGLDRSGKPISGQESLAMSAVAIDEVYSTPPSPKPNPEAISALQSADVVLIGPGSLYTSIIPNLLVDGVTEAIVQSHARVIYFCNVANMRGETAGFDSYDHVKALCDHGLTDVIDIVIVPDGEMCADRRKTVASLLDLGVEPLFFDVTDREYPTQHGFSAMCDVLERVL